MSFWLRTRRRATRARLNLQVALAVVITITHAIIIRSAADADGRATVTLVSRIAIRGAPNKRAVIATGLTILARPQFVCGAQPSSCHGAKMFGVRKSRINTWIIVVGTVGARTPRNLSTDDLAICRCVDGGQIGTTTNLMRRDWIRAGMTLGRIRFRRMQRGRDGHNTFVRVDVHHFAHNGMVGQCFAG